MLSFENPHPAMPPAPQLTADVVIRATIKHNGRSYPIDFGAAQASSLAAQHDPELYDSPSTFDPDRFLGENESAAKSNHRLFSKGSRACPGQQHFYVMAKLMMLLVVGRYDFESLDAVPNKTPRVPEWTTMDLVYGDMAFGAGYFSPVPRDGLRMTVTRRE
jgi:hypothetical protein